MGTPILWSVVIGFLAGVFLRSHLEFGSTLVALCITAGLGCLVAAFLEQRKTFALACLFCATAAAGVLRMESAIVEREPALDALMGKEVVLHGVIFDEPDVRDASVRLSVRVSSVAHAGATTSVDASALVAAPLHADVSYGDVVRVEGVLNAPESFETGIGRKFNYPGLLAKDGILYEVSFADVGRVRDGPENPLKALAIRAKQVFLQGLAATLPEPHAGLAGGITAGDKQGLGSELSDVFRAVGLTHIVVLSGYNIMVVVDALGKVAVRLSPFARFALGSIVAVFFALMTGLASASVRAAAMAVIALFGRATGRIYLAGRALATVAALMVLWNPYVLAFDIGFQLSVVATWGLVALSPLIERYLQFLPARFGVRDIATATVAAQLAVLPLLLYQSGELSVFALPANLLALLAVPWAMLFSALAALGGVLFGSLAVPFALPAYAFLSYITNVAALFASLPFATIHIGAFSAWWLLVVYGVMLLVAYKNSRPSPAMDSAA